jgi:hypothetical protein
MGPHISTARFARSDNIHGLDSGHSRRMIIISAGVNIPLTDVLLSANCVLVQTAHTACDSIDVASWTWYNALLVHLAVKSRGMLIPNSDEAREGDNLTVSNLTVFSVPDLTLAFRSKFQNKIQAAGQGDL